MRKILFTLLMFIPLLVDGQIRLPKAETILIDSYSILQFESHKKENGYDVSITCFRNTFGLSSYMTITFSPNQIEGLKNELRQVQAKYSDWTSVSRRNRVKEVTKDMPINITKPREASGDKMPPTNDVTIKPVFVVNNYQPQCTISIVARYGSLTQVCSWDLKDASLFTKIIKVIDDIRIVQRDSDNNNKRTEDLFH